MRGSGTSGAPLLWDGSLVDYTSFWLSGLLSTTDMPLVALEVCSLGQVMERVCSWMWLGAILSLTTLLVKMLYASLRPRA